MLLDLAVGCHVINPEQQPRGQFKISCQLSMCQRFSTSGKAQHPLYSEFIFTTIYCNFKHLKILGSQIPIVAAISCEISKDQRLQQSGERKARLEGRDQSSNKLAASRNALVTPLFRCFHLVHQHRATNK